MCNASSPFIAARPGGGLCVLPEMRRRGALSRGDADEACQRDRGDLGRCRGDLLTRKGHALHDGEGRPSLHSSQRNNHGDRVLLRRKHYQTIRRWNWRRHPRDIPKRANCLFICGICTGILQPDQGSSTLAVLWSAGSFTNFSNLGLVYLCEHREYTKFVTRWPYDVPTKPVMGRPEREQQCVTCCG